MKAAKNPSIVKAEAKRSRKAALRRLMWMEPIIPTGSAGAVFERGELRRFDREERRIAFNHESATAARRRHKTERSGKTRRKETGVIKAKSPVPEEFFNWSKAARRKWTADREVARQRAELAKLVAAGIPERHARIQFGALQNRRAA